MLGRLRDFLSWRKIAESWSMERLKPKITELIHRLQNSTDYDTPQVEETLKSLATIPELLCTEETLEMEGSTNDSEGSDDDDVTLTEPVFTRPEFVHRCHTVGKHLLKAGYIPLFVTMAESLKHHVCGGSRNEQQGWLNFGFLCWSLINYAEFTPEIGCELAQRGGIGILLQALDHLDKGVVRVKSEISNEKMKLLILCLVYHCRRENVQIYRQSKVVEVLTRYLQSKDLGRKTYALLTLANVISERENDILKAKDCINFLVQQLEEAVYSTNHTAVFKDVEGISVSVSLLDILDGINHLAVNDDNKRSFHKCGGTVFAVEILNGQFTDDEKALMSKILWKLSFIEEIKTTETFKRAKARLKLCCKSSHKELRKNSAFAIWECDGSVPDTDTINPVQQQPTSGQPSPAEQPPSTEQTVAAEQQTAAEPQPRVMLSYQWDSQKKVQRIKRKLEGAGFDVWMDINDMRGDMAEAMAHAVERSDVVIMCMTEKYKHSDNARSEATYAYSRSNKKKKPHLIPVLLEDGYEPDGWLGLLLGLRLYYRFCTDNDLKENMPKLIDAIRKRDND